MKCRHDCLKRGYFCLFVCINRNSTTIVYNTYTIFREHGDFDMVSKAPHSFVSSIVKNLPYQMVKAVRASGTNIHTGTLPNRLKAFKDDYIFGSIVVSTTIFGCFFRCFFLFFRSHNPKKRTRFITPLYQKTLILQGFFDILCIKIRLKTVVF